MSVLGSGRVLAYGGGYYGDDRVEEWDVAMETRLPTQDRMEVASSSFGSTVINITNCNLYQ